MSRRAILPIHLSKQKKMLKQTKSLRSQYVARASFHSLMIAALGLSLVAGWFMAPLALADRFDDQIRDLNSQNSQSYSALQDLEERAAGYQQVIDGLQAQIQSIQQQIDANVAEQARLQTEIVDTQVRLDEQKKFLGDSVKSMYVNDNLTTVEMLATSKNLSDFVDSETYRSAVQAKIQATLKQITALQNKLKDQKAKVDTLIAEQKQQRSDLDQSRAEQAHLLALNQDQQNSYNKQIKDNKDKINDLRRQQVIENQRLFGGSTNGGTAWGGNYPWGDATALSVSTYDYGYASCPSTAPNCKARVYVKDGVVYGQYDAWNYYFRNCTSYVAFKLAADGKVGLYGLGNATNWPDVARARGVPVTVGYGAKKGDAAVIRGYYGHVMYVEDVLSDGRVVVSDYNRYGDGLYRGPDNGASNVLSQSSLTFVHFP